MPRLQNSSRASTSFKSRNLFNSKPAPVVNGDAFGSMCSKRARQEQHNLGYAYANHVNYPGKVDNIRQRFYPDQQSSYPTNLAYERKSPMSPLYNKQRKSRSSNMEQKQPIHSAPQQHQVEFKEPPIFTPQRASYKQYSQPHSYRSQSQNFNRSGPVKKTLRNVSRRNNVNTAPSSSSCQQRKLKTYDYFMHANRYTR